MEVAVMGDIAIVLKEPPQTAVIQDAPAIITPLVNIGTPGGPGAKGEEGKVGPEGKEGKEGKTGSGDLHFVYSQGSASAEWEIEHNLEKFPSATVEDSAGEDVEGSIEYLSKNKLILTFSAAFSGTAYLN